MPNEPIHYEDDANVGPPLDAARLPSKRADDEPFRGSVDGKGPGSSVRNLSPARPRDASAERDGEA